MRHVTSTLCIAALLTLPGLAAGAETYAIRSGSLTDASTGRSRPLTGSFEASVFEPDPPDGATPVVLRFDDFELASGGRSLTPAAPIEFEGLLPVAYLVIGDGVVLEDDRVSSLHLRAGGELVGVSNDEVTYRFFELRSDSPPAGSASGRLGDSGLPRTLRLEGTLYEVEQSFSVSGPEDCAVTTPPPSPGGGGTSGGGGGGVIVSSGAVISYSRFEVPAVERIAFVAPAGSAGGGVVNRSSGDGASLIEGELVSNDDLLNPPGIVFGLAPATVPTLEELGIRAPGGAQVSLVSGALLVDAAGDLLVEGDFPAIPGLTSVTLRAQGSLVVTGTIHVAAGVSLRLEAGGSVDIADGGLDLPEPAPQPPPVGLPRLCNGLIPIHPATERALGSFSLVASAAKPIADRRGAPKRAQSRVPGLAAGDRGGDPRLARARRARHRSGLAAARSGRGGAAAPARAPAGSALASRPRSARGPRRVLRLASGRGRLRRHGAVPGGRNRRRGRTRGLRRHRRAAAWPGGPALALSRTPPSGQRRRPAPPLR